MRARPPSNLWARASFALVAATAATAACGGHVARSEFPKEPRRPDGVAVDPAMMTPPAKGEPGAVDGLTTLRSPLGTDRAIATVEEFFRRVVAEDSEALPRVFHRDAVAVQPAGGPSANAIQWWETRFRRLDYTKLAGAPLFRPADADVARGERSLQAAPVASMRAEAIEDDDVVLRTGVVTTHVGADRLFGDEIVFWLRRDGDRYKIYRILEDFQFN